MENLDTDIDKYTTDDLLTILNLSDPSEYQVTDAANTIIAKMKAQGNHKIADFFQTDLKKNVFDFF